MAVDPYTLAAGKATIEQVIAGRVTADLIPTIRAALKDVREIDELWDINGMSDLVAAHLASGEPLAEYDPKDWEAWQVVFNALLVWLATPIEKIGKTPLQVLGKWYTKVPPKVEA
jgi:hypothetical protein